MSYSDALIMHLSMLIMHLSMFSLCRGEVQAWGGNFGIPPKMSTSPLSPENMIS